MTRQEFRTLRKQMGLSQEQVAQDLEVSVETIRSIELGRSPMRRVNWYALLWLAHLREAPDTPPQGSTPPDPGA